MPLLGQGVLIIWHAMTPEADRDMVRWHNTEHVLERVSIPGFLRGRRYADAGTTLQYLDIYETESVETVRSPAYVARLNDPTSWTRRVLPHFRGTVRLGCRVTHSRGRGQGGAVVTVRLRPRAGAEDGLVRWLAADGAAALFEEPAVVGVHLLTTVAETTRVKTAEGKLKGGEVAAAEEPWPLVWLVETVDSAAATGVVERHLTHERLRARETGDGIVLRLHDLELTLDAP